MTSIQQEQLSKFKTLTRWMYGDAKEAMFAAGANYLVAMGLFNYTETIGMFLIGYFQRDPNGQIKKDKNGKNLRTSTASRFEAFLSYLGSEYQNLLKTHPALYDELRCGLTHEYLPKNYKFCIYGVDKRFTDDELDCLMNPIDRSQIMCGIVFSNGIYQIFTGKLVIDFERGIKKLIAEIEKGADQQLTENFFQACDNINLEEFTS